MTDSPIIIEVGSESPDSCVIWLHGLGADGHDFEPIVAELKLDVGLNTRFIFPHAPMIPVTINQGFVMRAWFDIRAASIDAEQDEKGIRDSSKRVNKVIEEQIKAGIKSERIVLAGFSQGGAIALHAALRYPERLAGIMALSTYLPLADTLVREKNKANSKIPILLAHGSIDPVIAVKLGQQSRTLLVKQGYKPEWHEYKGMQHSVSEKEIYDIAEWLEQVLLG
ncbi:MAG: alpha/beta hydrolase [Gammaproteobacteria bacterium]